MKTTQQKPNNSSYQSVPTNDSQKKEKPQHPTSQRDQPPTQEAVQRDGNKTYESYADHYLDQAP